MALTITTGYTDDGLVFMLFEGQQNDQGRPIKTTVTIEPDMARKVGRKMVDDSDKAMLANKRPLVLGQDQTFKKG